LEKEEKSSDIHTFFLKTYFKNFIQLSRIEKFSFNKSNNKDVELFVKRDDLIHKYVSGNKIRKLNQNIFSFYKNKCKKLVTFGGAFSNHLLATAALSNELSIDCVGIVRGEELNVNSNGILKKCSSLGMQLNFVSRSSFSKQKKMSGLLVKDGIPTWFIPEGGANLEGIEGCKEIVSENEEIFDYYVVAQGTTTTSIGIALALPPSAKIIVVPVLKGFNSKSEMKSVLNNVDLWNVIKDKIIVLDDFHFGGYAKSTNELREFISEINQINEMKIEEVYTGKALYALRNYLEKNFVKNKKVLFIHTGGIFTDKN
jgi:1-aminocyclopropane-1-carboxylate deaminase